MGIVRLLLALVVVVFHTTRTNWVPGRMAVDGFFVISGYVIARTLTRNYLAPGGSVPRFYLNRLLRLGPPYVVALLASGLLVAVVHYRLKLHLQTLHPFFFTAFDADTGDRLRSALTLTDLRPQVSALGGDTLRVGFAPWLLPQAWSIGVEACFYLVAPLLAVVAARRGTRGAAVVLAVCLVPWLLAIPSAGRSVDLYLYNNAVTSLWLFALGALLATLRGRVTLPPAWGLAAGAGLVLLLLGQRPFGAGFNVPPTLGALVAWQLVTGAAMAVVILAEPWRGRIGRIDRQAGDLSYGVYVIHGVAMLAVPLLGYALAPHGWSAARRLALIAGAPYTLRYGAVMLVTTLVLAWLLWWAVERPLAAVRTRVRRHPAPDPRPPLTAAEPPQVSVPSR